ncbi:MAG: hypothetical protein COB42_06770 [Sulfurimonas sp.]|nr:MAG: hypothetical protein COB42_06770 [Sulfurimonas sp.]
MNFSEDDILKIKGVFHFVMIFTLAVANPHYASLYILALAIFYTVILRTDVESTLVIWLLVVVSVFSLSFPTLEQ